MGLDPPGHLQNRDHLLDLIPIDRRFGNDDGPSYRPHAKQLVGRHIAVQFNDMDRINTFVSRHFLLLGLMSLAMGYASYGYVYLAEGSFHALSWKLTQFHVSYQEFGFIRRGLVGSILQPVLAGFPDGGAAELGIIIALDIGLFIAFMLVLRRELTAGPLGQTWMAGPVMLIIVASPVGAMQWAYDLGRFDHLNFLLLAGAVGAVRHQRYGLAGLCLGAGVLVHEALVIYGVPAFAVWALARRMPFPQILLLLTPAIVFAGLIGLYGDGPADMASRMDAAVIAGVGVWSRDVVEYQLWLNPAQYAIAAFYFLCPLLFLLAYILRRTSDLRLLLLLPAIIPASLFIFGIDYFRWAQLELCAVLLVYVLSHLDRPEDAPVCMPAAMSWVILLYCLPLGPVGVDAALPYVHQALSLLGFSGLY